MSKTSSAVEFATKFAKHLDDAPSPFHSVATVVKNLKNAGFTRLMENELWGQGKQIEKTGKYYYTRNASTLVAFCVGGKYKAGNGFKVVGAHTDSPVLKIKPVSKRTKLGYLQVGVECYGGGLWHTWLDRDLGMAGRVIVKDPKTGQLQMHLVHVNKAVLRVPSLCIHLQSASERGALTLNKEEHLTPILGQMADELNGPSATTGDKPKGAHCSMLLTLLARELDVDAASIVDMEISLTDTQPAAVGGASDEFVFGPRMDNQMHCFTSCHALTDFATSDALAQDDAVSLIALFDHEEVGSASAQGAGSPVMRDAVSRIADALATRYAEEDGNSVNDAELYKVALSRSMLVSADGAHAIHPNYPHKHESFHQPKMNEGTVIKTNSNQRYATNAITGFVIRELARKNDLQIQEFVVRNDCPCGSTIGPIIAANTGIVTIDIGIPQLSMHSIRETCGVTDLDSNRRLLHAFFKDGLNTLQSLKVEGLDD